jgi:hypothetical protein
MSDESPSGSFSFADERTACLDVRAVVESWLTVAPPPPPLSPERAQAAAPLLFEAGLTPVPPAPLPRPPSAPTRSGDSTALSRRRSC